jgi:carbamoyl-phosphate synthase large subunit
MKSTGEVMGIDRDFGSAFAKAQIGAGMHLPIDGRAFVSVRDDDKAAAVAIARSLTELGFGLVATGGTCNALQRAGIEAEHIHKVNHGRPDVVDAIKDGTIQLVVNTTEGAQAMADSYLLRRAALEHQIPYFTTLAGSRAMIRGIEALKGGGLDVAPLQSYSR